MKFNTVFFIFLVLSFSLTSVIFIGLSRRAEAQDEYYGLTMSKTKNFWGHRKPMIPRKTWEVSFPIYLTETEKDIFLQLEKELNEELGKRIFIFYFNGPGWCARDFSYNEVCFGRDERRQKEICEGWTKDGILYGKIKCPPIKDNHNGMFAGWAGTRKKGYDEFDIVMWDPVETASLRTLKHELLHAAGFAHVQHGVMNKYGVDGNQIDPVQLLNWKQAMKGEVWHEIIPNCYNRPDLPDCG